MTRPWKRRRLGSLALLVLLAPTAPVGACSSAASPTGSSCADAGTCRFIDPMCTMPTPSYATTIDPFLLSSCVNCHFPGSSLAQSSLATYEDIRLVFGAALDQVSNCLMPPQGYCPLDEKQRTELLTWLACGAPDN